jgi:subtilase family serine protease
MFGNCDKRAPKPGFEALESRLLLAADLTVTAAAGTYEALSGAAVNVDIQVNNPGDAAAQTDVNPGLDSWTVSLWRSDDAVFNALEDTNLGSYEVVTLGAAANTTDTVTFNAPAAGAYTLFGFADSDEEVTEDSEVNNTSIVGTLLVDSDLTVTAAADTYEALSGAAVTVPIQANNIGDAAAEADADPGNEPWAVSLWTSTDGAFDPLVDTLVGSYTRTTLAGGGTVTDNVVFNAPAAGTYTLFGWADSDEEVTESSEVNNSALLGDLLVGIDLEIQGAAGAYQAAEGANVDVDVTVENTGFAQAVTDLNPGVDTWTVSLWTSTDGVFDPGADVNVGSYELATLDGQDSTTNQISFAAPVPGEYTLFGFADSGTEVTEDDDANNSASLGTLSVGPDLTITAAATVYQAGGGQQVDVPVQVNNAGFDVAEDDANPGADPWTVTLWTSTDGAFDAGADTQVGSYNVTTLAAGANTTDTISFNAPAGGQGYTLFGVADQPGGVTEYSEANNVSVVGSLGVGPDLTIAIDDTYVTGADAIPGERSRIPVQVTNGGAGTVSGLATIQLYGSADGVIDPGDYLFGQRNYRILLQAGQTGTYWIGSQVPADIPVGNYNVLAVVDSGDTIAEADETNNTDAAANQAAIVWKSGGFDAAHRNARLTIEDPGSTPVTFIVRGSWAEVANGVNGFDITVHETTNRSRLFISTPRGTTTDIESVTVVDDVGLPWDGSLGGVYGRTTNFVDDGAGTSLIDVPGTLGYLWLNVVNGGAVQVGAPVGANDRLSMRLGSVTDLVVTSNTPVGSLFAQDWTDADAVPDVVNAPSIDHFRTTGAVNGLDLTLAGNPVPGRSTLGMAHIGGDLLNATWGVAGTTGRASVVGTINTCGLTFDEGVRSIFAGAIDNSALALATVNPAGAHATLGYLYLRGVGGNYFINNSTLDVWTIGRLYFGAASNGTGTITYNTAGRLWNAPTGVNLVVV